MSFCEVCYFLTHDAYGAPNGMTLEQIGEMTDYQLVNVYCRKRDKEASGDDSYDGDAIDYDNPSPADKAKMEKMGIGGGTVSADDFFAQLAKIQEEQDKAQAQRG